jgi:two-component system, LytTR family, response regulator
MLPKQVLKCVIIDDEPDAILLLEDILKAIEGITVYAHATDIQGGLNIILKHRPDMVFLDIKIHDQTGFDLIKSLKDYDLDPFIVMVTGYDQFGMEALKSGAFDYLLKPVDPSELMKVISRYNHKLIHSHASEQVQKIRFNTLGGFILIHPEEILYLKAEANYTDIFLINQQKHTISLNIGSIEKMLDNRSFFRISRSVIINLKYLIEINRSRRLCTLSHLDHIYPLCIAHDRIKHLEEAFVQ